MLIKKLVLHINRTNYLQRLLSTSQNVHFTTCADVSKTDKNPGKSVSISKTVQDYLKDTGLEYFIDKIPKAFLRRSCVSTSKLCLFDPKTAKEISLIISESLLQNTSYVIECNPGLGLLTHELLKIGVPRIHIYEKFEYLCNSESPLGKLIIEYKERLDIQKISIFDLWMILLRDQHTSDDISSCYLSNMPYHSWQDDPFAQIIVQCPSKNFISLLIHNFFNQTTLFDHGRATFFLILPLDVWLRATAHNTDNKQLLRYYNQYSVLIHLFFEFKYLGEVPRQAFGPWPKVKPKEKINKIDIPMQVIKLQPKSNTFDLIKKENLRPFWFFLKHGMRSKRLKVIQEMEKWVPGCGPRLIALNIDICTTFKEMSPAQLFELFKNFYSWPEYSEDFFVPLTHADEIKKEDDEKVELEEAEPEPENVIENEVTEKDNAIRHSIM